MNAPHLLLVSLGPVQEFIAQARRTRDLWFGSHVLSELSRAAAAALAARAVLIFPALTDGDPELVPCDSPLRPSGEAPIAIANKIVAAVPADADPRELAAAARDAALKRWKDWAEEIRKQQAAMLDASAAAIWQEQIDETVEFYAAWAPLDKEYGEVRKRVEQALAGRKGLRDFGPIRNDPGGIPKSSLDGARVSVLKQKGARVGVQKFATFKIGAGEQLDAVGVVKRTGGEPRQFVPIMNIAAGPWLKRAQAAARDELDALCNACDRERIHGVERRDLPVGKLFGYDASVLYPSRWPSLFEELKQPTPRDRARINQEAREWGDQYVSPLSRAATGLGLPPSYVACLVADGDNMGRTINALVSAEQNRDFSKRLADFPTAGRTIVQNHLGSLAYAGGDDVLAFLPVEHAPFCAVALAEKFAEIMRKAVPSEVPVPTLSVGIGIGHIMESMAVLLELGREAERAAKNNGRNSLAIVVDKRSGGKITFVETWTAKPIDRLSQDAALIGADGERGLSVGKIYEVGEIVRRFPKPPVSDPQVTTALCCYVEGALAQSQRAAGGTDQTSSRRGPSLTELGIVTSAGGDYSLTHRTLKRGVDRLLVSKALRESGFGRSGRP